MGDESPGRKLPPISVADSLQLEVSDLSLRLFPQGILVVSLEGDLPDATFGEDFTPLGNLRRTSTNGVASVFEKALSLALGSEKGRWRSGREAFLIDVEMNLDPALVRDFVKNKRHDMVALLIGADAEGITDSVVDSVFRQSEEQNVKASGEYLLMNGQGAVRLTSADQQRPIHSERLHKLSELWMLGLYAQAFFRWRSDTFHESPVAQSYITKRINGWMDDPALFLPTSLANQISWRLISHLLGLRALAARWNTDVEGLVTEEARRAILAAGSDKWLEEGFPDSLDVQVLLHGLQQTFIQDSTVAAIVDADIIEARRSLATGNYRAAAVFSGAAIEGMLLGLEDSARRTTSAQPGKSLKTKNLNELVGLVCPDAFLGVNDANRARQNLIDSRTGVLILRVCKPWRNLIHAGAASRADRISADEASLAVSAIAIVDRQCGEAAQRGFLRNRA
jgi:hypothetical protein